MITIRLLILSIILGSSVLASDFSQYYDFNVKKDYGLKGEYNKNQENTKIDTDYYSNVTNDYRNSNDSLDVEYKKSQLKYKNKGSVSFEDINIASSKEILNSDDKISDSSNKINSIQESMSKMEQENISNTQGINELRDKYGKMSLSSFKNPYKLKEIKQTDDTKAKYENSDKTFSDIFLQEANKIQENIGASFNFNSSTKATETAKAVKKVVPHRSGTLNIKNSDEMATEYLKKTAK